MIWHVVRFDASGIDEDTRAEYERQLAGLAELDVVEFLRVSRDLYDPDVIGLIVAVADEAALAAYRDHPEHQPVVQRTRELGLARVAVDVVSDDAPGTFA